MQVVCSRIGNVRSICFRPVLVSSGYHNRTPHTAWLTEQIFIFSQLWRFRSLRSRCCQVRFLLRPLSWGLHSVCSVSHVCTCPWSLSVSPNSLSWQGHRSDWVRAHLNASFERNHLFNGFISKYGDTVSPWILGFQHVNFGTSTFRTSTYQYATYNRLRSLYFLNIHFFRQ